jgi:hypothetical protein
MDLMDLKPTSDTVDVLLKHPTTFEPLTNEDGSNDGYYCLCSTL